MLRRRAPRFASSRKSAMRNLTARSWLVVATLWVMVSPVSHAQDSTTTVERIREVLAPVTEAGHARDSLSALADKATGETSSMYEEQVWQRQVEFQSALLDAVAELESLKKQGWDVSVAQTVLQGAVRAGWPRYLRQLDRRIAVMAALVDK